MTVIINNVEISTKAVNIMYKDGYHYINLELTDNTTSIDELDTYYKELFDGSIIINGTTYSGLRYTEILRDYTESTTRTKVFFDNTPA